MTVNVVDQSSDEEYYYSIFYSASDAIIGNTLDGVIKSWNPQAENLFGYASKEAIDQPLSIIIPQDEYNEFHGLIQKIKKNEKVEKRGMILECRNGQKMRMSMRLSPIKNREGAVTGIALFLSETKPQDLSYKKLFQIMEAVPDCVVIVNRKNDIIYVNSHTERTFGYERNELITLPFDILIDSDDQAKYGEFREQYFKTREDTDENFGIELHCIRKSRDIFPVDISPGTILTNGSTLEIAFIKDITVRKSYDENIKRSNEDLEKFAYITSHDLKAPLRAIEWLSQSIESDQSNVLSAQSQENLDLLRQRTRRMHNMIEGILQYSRAIRNTEASVISIKDLLKEIVESLDPPQSTTIHIAENMPTLKTSRIQLGQVFGNLVDNAIKYNNHADAHIEIGMKESGDFYEFYVADDGPGIDPKYHDLIFEMFNSLHARDEVESTGIGLAIVKKIVESQGGKVSVDSSEGKGATFRFLWPKKFRQYVPDSARHRESIEIH